MDVPPFDPKSKKPNHFINVRDALAKSDNDAATKILLDVGPANVVAWAHALGIESELKPDRSLALGAYEVKPMELVSAFATFASGGEVLAPFVVSKITRSDGTVIPLPERPPARRVMEVDEAYLATSLMRSVVTSGTGKRALALGRPVAGKTGTSNESSDTWFVGYTTDYVCVVWVGYDDRHSLGLQESGASLALPAWVSFMKAAHEGRPITEFVRPNTIVTARIDHASGLLPRDEDTAIEEEFLDGTVPTAIAPDPDAGAPAPVAPASATKRAARDAGVVEEPPPF
jgi:penicillin-binding protein 1A